MGPGSWILRPDIRESESGLGLTLIAGKHQILQSRTKHTRIEKNRQFPKGASLSLSRTSQTGEGIIRPGQFNRGPLRGNERPGGIPQKLIKGVEGIGENPLGLAERVGDQGTR